MPVPRGDDSTCCVPPCRTGSLPACSLRSRLHRLRRSPVGGAPRRQLRRLPARLLGQAPRRRGNWSSGELSPLLLGHQGARCAVCCSDSCLYVGLQHTLSDHLTSSGSRWRQCWRQRRHRRSPSSCRSRGKRGHLKTRRMDTTRESVLSGRRPDNTHNTPSRLEHESPHQNH